METIIGDYIGTTIGIHSPIPGYAPGRLFMYPVIRPHPRCEKAYLRLTKATCFDARPTVAYRMVNSVAMCCNADFVRFHNCTSSCTGCVRKSRLPRLVHETAHHTTIFT